MKMIIAPKNFSELKLNLELCDKLFLQHQVQLLHKKNEQAFAIFEKLTLIRKVHLTVMEDCLLPVFKKTLQQIPDGAKPLYFEREKKQILKYLNKYIRKLGSIILNSEELDIVTLFEEYAWFKDLMDHHDAREKAFLFPILDEKLQKSEKIELLNIISGQFAVLERNNV